MRRACFVILLLLLFSPTIADGWFAEQRLERNIRYGDPQELRGLLGTLIPDVRYEMHGNVIVAFGSSAALDQVQYVLEELDRPFDRFVVEVNIVEILKVDSDPFAIRRQHGRKEIAQTGSGEPIPAYLCDSPRSHARSWLSWLVSEGDIKLLMTKRLEQQPGSSGSLKLPNEVALALFGDKSAKLGVKFGRVDWYKSETEITVRSSKNCWQTRDRLRNFDPFIVTTERSSRYVVLLTSSPTWR